MKERLYSLDLLRGLDIFFLTVFSGIVWAAHEGLGLFPVPPGTPDGYFGPVMEQLAHRWGAFHLIDIVMPMFIFMCGAAIPFALGRRLKDGKPTAGFWKHLGARFLLLWFCGMIAQGNLLSFDRSQIRLFDNTLQTIACGYAIAALVLLIRRRWVRWLMPVLLALAYSVPLAVCGDYTPDGNLAHLVERRIVDALCVPLGFSAELTDYTWFATIPMFGVMTLMGMVSTEILMDREANGARKAIRLGLLGAAVLALGWIAYPFVPSIKHIFTFTFTAQAMGWCMLALALLYYVTDVLMFRRGLGLFILFGQFALTAYMLADTPLAAITAKAAETFTHGFEHLVGKGWTTFLSSVVQGALVTFAVLVRRRLKTGGLSSVCVNRAIVVLVSFFLAGSATAQVSVDALLGRMSLEEKVGQLVQLGSAGYASDDQSKVAISDELRTAIREGRVGSLIGACGVKKFNELQRLAKEESRLGIPLMVGHDVIHGCRTVLPIPLGLSCAWDADLWRRGAEMMAVEALSRGCNWTFNPMVDISRDARWGRIAESPGQDPLLAARYAAAMVKGYQGENSSDGRHIAACLKHYLAYGACEGGRDYNTVELSDDTMRNAYLPPFAAGVRAGALTVMPAFHAINGEPCSANRYLLTNVLRGELGFAGFTISDYNAIGELASGHAVAESPAAAAVQAVNAGMDMDMMSGCYRDGLLQAVREGRVSMKTLDTAVRRILSVKKRLGLFERPYIDADILDKIDVRAHHALAREAAAKSVVLVKNERKVLPLKEGRKIVLLGSLSDDRLEMLGCWQLWKEGYENATVREGLVADGAAVEYVSAYTPTGTVDRAAIRAAVAKADVVVASFGESCWDYASMNGENCSRADIGLPGRQLEAVEEIKASGKPFVALLFCGRPLAVPELMDAADAVVVAWNPGSSGGWGVADVLTGRSEPYGRLTVDFPHKTGECPLYYNRLPTGRPWTKGGFWVTKYIDAPSPGRSLLPFGHGLTYTMFTYEGEKIQMEGSNVVFAVTVRNAGARPGSEVVQAYVRDLVASVSRPRRELKGFARVALKPGESREVRIAVPKSELGFWHRGNYAVEPGEFVAWIASDSDSGKELRFRIDE